MNTTLSTPTAPKRNAFPANLWRTDDTKLNLPRRAHLKKSGIHEPLTQADGAVVERHAATSGLDRVESQKPASREHAIWSVVLAGGEGQRLRALTERWWGVPSPQTILHIRGSPFHAATYLGSGRVTLWD